MSTSTASGPRSYRVREFAELAGVTVRTLHHYDRAGLLTPRRTRAGYRIYLEADLPRLQQILVLKYLGLPLADIAEAVKSPSRLGELLKTRRYTVRRKREQLALVLHLLDEVQAGDAASRNWTDLASFVRDLGSQSAPEGTLKKRRLDEARRLVGERRMEWNATLQDYELNRDVRAAVARGETPDTPMGKALVARWRDVIRRFTAGDQRLREALQVVMNERPGGPSPAESAYREYLDRAFQQA